jgi:hypothetical protein
MMLHALAALDRAQVSYDAVVTIAHSSQSTIPEHPTSMHCQMIQSNLDDERYKDSRANGSRNLTGAVNGQYVHGARSHDRSALAAPSR